MNSPDKLSQIVARLVEAFQPERIYLFGSMARQDFHADSDIDLMVVVPDSVPERLCRSRLAYQALRGTGAAAEVLIWRRSAFEERLQLKASLPSTSLREGRLLYGA